MAHALQVAPLNPALQVHWQPAATVPVTEAAFPLQFAATVHALATHVGYPPKFVAHALQVAPLNPALQVHLQPAATVPVTEAACPLQFVVTAQGFG